MANSTPYAVEVEWPIASLVDVTTKIGSGATPRGGASSYLIERHRYAFVRSQNVYDRRFDSEALAFISDDQAAGLRGASLQPGDVLLNITGDGVTFGRAAMVDESVLPACVNQHVSIVRADPTVAVPGYLLAYLTHPDVKPYIASFNSGGSRRAVTKGHIESFQIPLPPLEVQRAISATLGALDDKITSSRRTIDLAEALLDALSASVAEMLPDTRLGTVTTVSKRSVDPKTYGNRRVAHFSLPAFDVDACPEDCAATAIMSNKLLLDAPAVLVSRLNPRINRTWWAQPLEGIPAMASTEFAVLTAATLSDLAGVWLAVRSPSFREELPRRVTGTSGSHQRVRPGDLLSIDVPDVRQLDPASRAAALTLLGLVSSRRSEVARLAALRDALLPGLMSGQISVPRVAEVVA